MEKMKSLRIVELRAENVKRLKAVTVSPSGDVVVVSGKNGQGKSSLLDSIEYAFGGKASHAAEVIRRGEEEARVVADLGDLVVERRWKKSEKGEVSTVVVRGKDGARYDKPQAVLDALYNHTLDPVAFMRLKPEQQLERLKELAGLNLGPLDGKRADLYEKRTEVNRRGGDLKARFSAMQAPPANLPTEPVDLKALLAEQERMRKVSMENQQARSDVTKWKAACEARVKEQKVAQQAVEDLRKRLHEAEEQLGQISEALVDARELITKKMGEVGGLVDPDFTEIGNRISGAEMTNLAIIRAKDHAAIGAELEVLRASSEKLSEDIKEIDRQKAAAIAGAKFPVPGLGLGATGPTFNGLPLEQASSAEQLRVSVAMGLAMNPVLRVLLVRDGSLLDSESMELLETMAHASEAQLWVERVADGAEVGVVIEDGGVKASKPKLRAVGDEGSAA